MVSSLDLEEVCSRSIGAFRRILPFGSALIRLLEGDVLLTAAITPEGESPLEVRSPADQGLAGAVLSSVEPVYVEDVSRGHAGDPSSLALGSDSGIRSYLGLALADGAGFLGVLELGSPEPRAFSRDQIASAVQLAPSLAIAIRNAQAAAARGLPDLSETEQVLDEDFMSLVAHELRTPLAVVLGCGETMSAKAESLEPVVVSDLSRRVVSAGHRLERLMADLFDMSRIRNGSLHVVPVPTSLRSIASRAAGEAPRGLDVSVDLEDRLPLVDVDPDRLVQVLRILLENAWKHAGEDAAVEILARREEGGVCIEVADRGPGIAPEVLHKVFDPFVQAEEPLTRRVGGLGIGLFLARGICDLMDARIDAGERAGGGTSVVVHLNAATGSLEPVS
jgi:signal transduction histidine kinase